MRRLLDIVFLIVIIFTLNGIKDELHHACDILTSLDNNIYEVEMHTSGLERPEDIMPRRKYQKESMDVFMKLPSAPFSVRDLLTQWREK